MDKETENILEEIGLSDGERKVYLTLLDLGEATSGPIAEKSGVSASKVYQVADRLIRKGLIGSSTVRGTKHFKAMHPRALLDHLGQRRSHIAKLEESATALIPTLAAQYEETTQETEVQLLQGKPSLRTVFWDMIDEMAPKEEYQVLGASYGLSQKEWIDSFFLRHHKRRAEKGVRVKLLFQRFRPPIDFDKRHSKTKFLPLQLHNPLQIVTYHDTTIMHVLNPEPIIVRVKNEHITKSFRQYFDTLWNQDTLVSTGFAAFEEAWNSSFDKLKKGDSYNVLGAAFGTGKNQQKFAKYFERLHKRRVQDGIKGRVLFQRGAADDLKKFGLEELYGKDLQTKMLPFKQEFPVEIYPQGDTTHLLIQKEEPTVITIKNREVTESFLNFFETLWNQHTVTWTGDEAIELLADEVVQSKTDLYLIGAHGHMPDRYPETYKRLVEGIKKSKKQRHHLAKENTRGTDFNKGANVKAWYLPANFFSPMVIWIYGDSVAHVMWEDELTIFRVQNKKIADDYRAYFDLLKKQAST